MCEIITQDLQLFFIQLFHDKEKIIPYIPDEIQIIPFIIPHKKDHYYYILWRRSCNAFDLQLILFANIILEIPDLQAQKVWVSWR
jgi:hypothetical protein